MEQSSPQPQTITQKAEKATAPIASALVEMLTTNTRLNVAVDSLEDRICRMEKSYYEERDEYFSYLDSILDKIQIALGALRAQLMGIKTTLDGTDNSITVLIKERKQKLKK